MAQKEAKMQEVSSHNIFILFNTSSSSRGTYLIITMHSKVISDTNITWIVQICICM